MAWMRLAKVSLTDVGVDCVGSSGCSIYAVSKECWRVLEEGEKREGKIHDHSGALIGCVTVEYPWC